jgi:hypothetical protein
MTTNNHKEQFPDVHDDRPQVIRVRFDNHPARIDRGVLATAASLRIGDRLYVNIAGYGHAEEWVATEILDNAEEMVVVRRVP